MDYSILMSVYQKEHPDHFRDAIQSMVNQSIPPKEFVLICDGPLTPALDAVIEAFCLEYPEWFRVIRLAQNVGLGAALNRGITECQCEYIARMDADDIAPPDRMEKQLQAFSMHPEVSVIGGQIAEFETDPDQITEYRIVPQTHEKIIRQMKFSNPINHVTTVYKKSDILAAGNYPDHPGFEDYHLWINLACEGKRFYNLPEVCCKVRADSSMLERREGLSYFKQTLKLERLLLHKKFLTRWQYFVNVTIRFGGTVILPSGVRKKVFSKLMRKKNL